MKAFPSPPVVSAAISGFVVGVILTLLLTGALSHRGQATAARATLPPAQTVSLATFRARATRIVLRQLGPYPDRRRSRLVSLRVTPLAQRLLSAQPGAQLQTYRSLSISFRLYDNPLGRAWRLRSAKSDVFFLLKALYTSRLPIYNIRLVGTFPLKSGSTNRERPALTAYMNFADAQRVPWKRWGRDHESDLWNNLTSKHVDSWFA